MPGGGTRAARGGEPAGAPTPRGGGCPVATPSQPPRRPAPPAAICSKAVWDRRSRCHDAAADGRAALAQRRVVHKSWGKPITPGNELPPLVWVAHPACWGSRWRSAARNRIPRSREQRKTGETGMPQERWTLVAGRG